MSENKGLTALEQTGLSWDLSDAVDLPNWIGMKVRVPKPHEHPLTLDMRIADAEKSQIEKVIDAWRKVSDEVGTTIVPGNPEQQRLIKEFWDNFDPSCLYPNEVFHPINTMEEITVVFRYSDQEKPAIEEQKKLAEGKKIDDQTDA